MKTIKVRQYVPESKDFVLQEYHVPNPAGATVLQALQYIYEELDPSLAFRFGCRYNHCGLCGMMINGKPRLACKARLDAADEVAPLAKLPLLRSLVVNRSAYMRPFHGFALYPQGQEVDPLGQLHEDPLHQNLMKCLECLCCVSSCPQYTYKEGNFGGPYILVKLAQLHLDPRDQVDRTTQAKSQGVGTCADCKKCACPNGIQLHKAIDVLTSKKI